MFDHTSYSLTMDTPGVYVHPATGLTLLPVESKTECDFYKSIAVLTTSGILFVAGGRDYEEMANSQSSLRGLITQMRTYYVPRGYSGAGPGCCSDAAAEGGLRTVANGSLPSIESLIDPTDSLIHVPCPSYYQGSFPHFTADQNIAGVFAIPHSMVTIRGVLLITASSADYYSAFPVDTDAAYTEYGSAYPRASICAIGALRTNHSYADIARAWKWHMGAESDNDTGVLECAKSLELLAEGMQATTAEILFKISIDELGTRLLGDVGQAIIPGTFHLGPKETYSQRTDAGAYVHNPWFGKRHKTRYYTFFGFGFHHNSTPSGNFGDVLSPGGPRIYYLFDGDFALINGIYPTSNGNNNYVTNAAGELITSCPITYPVISADGGPSGKKVFDSMMTRRAMSVPATFGAASAQAVIGPWIDPSVFSGQMSASELTAFMQAPARPARPVVRDTAGLTANEIATSESAYLASIDDGSAPKCSPWLKRSFGTTLDHGMSINLLILMMIGKFDSDQIFEFDHIAAMYPSIPNSLASMTFVAEESE